jgi:hypothetical protein
VTDVSTSLTTTSDGEFVPCLLELVDPMGPSATSRDWKTWGLSGYER